jgi:predicted transglutaminase-like cysteine proteinase
MRILHCLAIASFLSAATAHPIANGRIYPPLFGSQEDFNYSLKKFPKWVDMLKRWQNSAPCEAHDCTTSGWQDLIERLRGEDRMVQLKAVNSFFNASRYMVDSKNWGKEDYWETPYEFLKRKGDCEDYAIAKFMALKALGVPKEDMRVLALRDLNLGVGHAVLIVYEGDTPLLLDNQIKTIVPANSVKHYQPVYSINETGWWLHRQDGTSTVSSTASE